LIKIFLLLLFFTFIFASKAETFKAIEDLSLAEILEIEVTSNRIQSYDKAASVVSVISKEGIAAFGGRHLRDIIDRLTNTQVIGSNLYIHNRVSTRGVTLTHVDNSILFLLNGRPIRESVQAGVNSDLYLGFPLDVIERIEFVRGPGSVLYGTNAFSGAINIVTVNKTKNVKTSISVGSHKHKEINASGGVGSESKKILGSMKVLETEGDKIANLTDTANTTSTYTSGKSSKMAFVDTSFLGFRLNALIGDVKQDSLNDNYTFPIEPWRIERQFINLDYQHDINKNWNVTLAGTYNGLQHRANRVGGDFGNIFEAKSSGYLTELIVRGEVENKAEIIFGGLIEKNIGTNVSKGSQNVDVDSTSKSYYGQLDYHLTSDTKLIAGIQVNKAESRATDYSPRLGSLYNFNNWLIWKLLYGKAYRAPSGTELFIDVSSLKGNPNLNSETIETFESSFIFTDYNYLFTLTFYKNKHRKIIIRKVDPSTSVSQYENGDGLDYQGAELEGKYKLSYRWNFIGNASYQENKTLDGVRSTTFNPQLMMKLGVSYNNKLKWGGGVFNSFFSKAKDLVELNSSSSDVNHAAKSYNLMTARLRVSIPETWLSKSIETANFFIDIDNLFNEKIYFPSYNRQGVNTIPHHDGRSFFARLELTF